MSLYVKKLDPNAKLPTCVHPGEDLGYDLYALEDTLLPHGDVTMVRTGIAIECVYFGFLIRDRSSMAFNGVMVSAGVIDRGYRGEIKILMTRLGRVSSYTIKAGDKIAQMIPIKSCTYMAVEEVSELSETARGEKGFGSTGQ